MYEETKNGLEEAQTLANRARETIMDTNRTAVRNYLRAAFSLQRAGLEAIEALQRGAEELTFTLLDRAEDTQSRAGREAEARLRESAERLRSLRERLQERYREERAEMGEAGERTESRLRESAEIGMKVARVIETRIETMLTELLDLGRRELEEIEERIDDLVERLDRELEEEIHPVPNYDDKTVDEVVASLDGLDEMQLRTVRAYEVNHKNRVTVLRGVDERLAQKDEVGSTPNVVQMVEKLVEEPTHPIVGYDEMNAQQVEAAIQKLDVVELGIVRAYELANKNRVTVLRALDQELEQRSQELAPAYPVEKTKRRRAR
jgi:hypothetical protein